MTHLFAHINKLIALSIQNELITPRDTIYVRNRLLALFNEEEYEETELASGDLYETLEHLATLAVQKGLIEDSLYAKDIFTSTLMDTFLPLPSLIEEKFFKAYEKSPQAATNYFYKLSQAANYIKMSRIAKNVFFKANSPYGAIDITINLSKPEKDPKEIARLKTAPPNKYPSCLLCIENEGYAGTIKLPDRANHRTIGLTINKRNWRLQYSPYLYYNEHCILLSETHEPMKLSKDSFYNLLGFVKQFPHYFIGSNADLPIVGGSILAHEHYQGGCYKFPIHHATTLWEFQMKGFPDVTCKVLNWPLSTIELSSPHLEAVAEATDAIYQKWMYYSDEEADILSHTEDVRHNTITPIAEQCDGNYVMKVVLRNNRTSPEHPLGIFHPHSDVQHIKKENIGLIEVMGLAILPGRLLEELEVIKNELKGEAVTVADHHLTWVEELKKTYSSNEDLDLFMQNALGAKFSRVLEDAGVFKLTEVGLIHFKHFIETL
ncbi:galactose-1-phosphate uridylyltransferase [Sporanaerobium hydrogeniformans]|uniref:Galactose-1-phosphate uridylyltransferase n=1 Tax=Sporanaerobium hydrogeniformans TaxID=3072179 RepID=A0AC61DBT0_9FIRM|nr:UDP-glucose--hexose-1-phosphate uridylyltransferase [Sporanaerobium hydrogeniformans]PHV70116.1 galactose-1-phosphate uridylyltransferase [Sporanaerobium hydrogeniformans]